jgi:hypothetical protein
MRQQLPERDFILGLDVRRLAAGVEAGQDVRGAEFGEDRGDVGVKGLEDRARRTEGPRWW